MMWHRLSLKYRIAVTIFVLEAVMVAVTLWQMSSLSLEAGSQHFSRQTEATITLLSDLSRIALLTEEYAELQPYIEQIGREPYVAQVFLTNVDNKVVSTTHPSLIGLRLPSLDDEDEKFWGRRELSNEAGPLGLLAIQFSRAPLLQSIREARNRGLTIAIVGMAIIAMIGLLMGYVLTRRLELIERAAQRFAEGQLNATANLTGNDELAQLGQTFDKMARKIAADRGAQGEQGDVFELAVSGTNDGIWTGTSSLTGPIFLPARRCWGSAATIAVRRPASGHGRSAFTPTIANTYSPNSRIIYGAAVSFLPRITVLRPRTINTSGACCAARCCATKKAGRCGWRARSPISPNTSAKKPACTTRPCTTH